MTIDTERRDSPGWWLNRLATELHNRRSGRDGRGNIWTRRGVRSSRQRPPLMLLDDYLRGDPPLRDDIHSGWAAAFRQYLRVGRLNVAPMLVSAPANRMGIRDFRTAAASDELGDAEARKLMRHNDLRLKVREVHDQALGLGDGYAMVTPPDRTRPWSLITAESPLHCITAEDPMSGRTIAALKMFRDDWDATDWAYLFLPGELWVARADVASSTLFRPSFTLSSQWRWDEDRFDDVPGERVAIERLRNKDGRSEIEGHLNHLDRINDKVFGEWWLGKLQAHRQRAIERPKDGEDDTYFDEQQQDPTPEGEWVSGPTVTGQDSDHGYSDDELAKILTSSPDSLWDLPPGAKLWESTPTDVQGAVNSIKSELMWLAATSFNPLHSITPDAAEGSAEGATLQREEHVYKIEDRRDRANGFWARVLAMAFEFQGDRERADVTAIDAIWAPIERYSLQERTTAARAVKGILPDEAILTDVLQYETADVQNRLRPMLNADLLRSDTAPRAPQGFGAPTPAPANES